MNIVHRNSVSCSLNYNKSRVVYNSKTINGCSSNWKADWYRLQGKSYAQVVCSNLVNNSSKDSKSRGVKFESVSHRNKCWTKKAEQITHSSYNSNSTGHFQLQRPRRWSPTTPRLDNTDCHPALPLQNKFAPLSEGEEFSFDIQTVNVNSSTYDPDIIPSKSCSRVSKQKQMENCNKLGTFVNKVVDNTVNERSRVSALSTECRRVTHDHKQPSSVLIENNVVLKEINPNNDSSANQKPGKFCPGGYLPEDKYQLALAVKNKNKQRLQRAISDPTHQKWLDQNAQKFGFVPLGPLLIPDSDLRLSSNLDPIKLYDITKNTNSYNFMAAQIQLKSQLNPDVWEQLLQGYWDSQLCYLIRYGFPLDFDRTSTLGINSTNHKSTLMYPNDVEAYLKEEIAFGAIVGPFPDPPFKEFHISPFMTREKPGGDHRRVIMDLSFPHGMAVNTNISKDSYLGTEFLLTLPSIDHITNKIKQLGKGSFIYKVDISRAFRHIKIDPRDYFLLGLKHENYYLDTCLPFGYRNGSGIFQRLSDAIRFIMKNMGYDVINYIDDVIGFGTISTASPSYHSLLSLLEKLGLDISRKKLVQPCTKATCLGVEVDTTTFTVAVPQEKLQNIHKICIQWVGRQKCSKKELQSLLGSLLYISKCVHSSRIFLNRMLDTSRAHFGRDNINLDQNFHRDLNWFIKFLPHFNGVIFFNHVPFRMTIELDACLQGLGAICRNQVYAVKIPKNFENYSIVHLKMLNILVALRIWCQQWATHRILLKCDNQAVVSVLNSGKTHDLTLGAMARNIAMILAINDIDLQVIHVLGADNKIADLLSRWYIIENPVAKLKKFIENPVWLNVHNEMLTLDWSI